MSRITIPVFRIGQILVDLLLVLTVYVSVYLVRFEGNIPREHIGQFWFFIALVPLIRVSTNYLMGLYYHLWKYFGMREMITVFYATSLGTLFFILVVYLSGNSSFPRSIFVIEWALMLLAFLLIRSSRRFSQEIINVNKKAKQRALIVGAGEAGKMLVSEMHRYPENTYMPVGFIDDSPQKIKAKINGVKVLGNRNSIPKVVKDWEIDLIIISIPSASPAVIREIVDICNKTGAQIKIIPAIHEIISGNVRVNQIREVKISDLLGRKQIVLDDSELFSLIRDKKIMVTGAGGSIGSELCLQLCKYQPAEIILLGHGENSIFKISGTLSELYPQLKKVRCIADIRDRSTLERIFAEHRPHLVFHAAAHKHVPLMEENLFEAIMNNVYGTKQLVELSDLYGVEKFVNISTDKAVKPSSIMGTTKHLAEIVVKNQNRKSATAYMTVRFGNVIGSRGSVIPLFQEQIKKGGPVTVTHPEMTRFFMTIPEAVQLVMQASAIGKGGEIFVLDMGEPIKITDLAKNMIRLSGFSEKEIAIAYTGVRDGEKLHEELFMDSENIEKTKHEKIMVSAIVEISDELAEEVDILLEKARLFDREKVYASILKLIPSYNKPNFLNENTVLDHKLSK